jgi:lysophospholipase L1-like esterase
VIALRSRATNNSAVVATNTTESPITIVCLGDSVTGVYYHTGGRRAYPEMLELALKEVVPAAHVRVINAGISGHTTKEGLARLDRDVLKHAPQIVTISFGLNDMSRIREEEFVQNLTTLVERCRAAKSLVALCTPNSVINTEGRPVEKLIRYCDRIREVGHSLNVPVCDQFAAGTRLQLRDAWTWRKTLSDEIHPNMDGHRLMARQLCRTISGRDASLDHIAPPHDTFARTLQLLKQGKPVRVLAMTPFDSLIGPALKQLYPEVAVEVTEWKTEGKSLQELEREAQQTVRPMKPDLVIVAIPTTATANSDEQFFRSYSWVMNWSLSFGHQEWDCVVIHPSVWSNEAEAPHSQLIRQLVRAQDLTLIDRPAEDRSTSAELLGKALRSTE